jgi:2-polyprenyl-3-methyl-5-hydroxy-6-metoxy-1,4-benzoquinol methylase
MNQVYGDTQYPFFEVVNSPSQVEFDSKRFESALVEITKIKSTGSILDIGCGSGLFLELARERGFETAGIEPLKIAREYAIVKRGLEIHNDTAEKFSLNRQFDIITLWELLDHVIYPNTVIQNTLKHLKPGGIILFSVRNGHSLAARVLRQACNMFLGYAHLNFWNTGSIQLFLQNHRLKSLNLSNYISEVNPVNNYLNFEEPYTGNGQSALPQINTNYIFICIAQA